MNQNQNFFCFSIFLCLEGKLYHPHLQFALSLSHKHTQTLTNTHTHTNISSSQQSQGTFQSSQLDKLKMETDGLPYIRKWGATYPSFAHTSQLSHTLSLSLSLYLSIYLSIYHASFSLSLLLKKI